MDTKKPATITAKQFVDDGYAEKVAKGECIVIEEYITDLHKSEDAPCRFYDYKQMYFGETNQTTVEYPEDHEFVVFWLTTPKQPAAMPPVASGQQYSEGDFQIVRDGIDMNKSIAPPVNALNRIEQELATLRQQLAAANERARGLEKALSFIANNGALQKPVRIPFDTGNADDREVYGYDFGLWEQASIARKALAAREPAAGSEDNRDI